MANEAQLHQDITGLRNDVGHLTTRIGHLEVLTGRLEIITTFAKDGFESLDEKHDLLLKREAEWRERELTAKTPAEWAKRVSPFFAIAGGALLILTTIGGMAVGAVVYYLNTRFGK